MVSLIKEIIIYMVYRETGKILIPKIVSKDYNYELYNINVNDFNNEEKIHKIPIKDIIVLIDEFNYPNNDKTYKNLLTYLDGIREHNKVITFIISNKLNLHENKRCISLFEMEE